MTPSRRGALALVLGALPGPALAAAWHVPGDADTIAEALSFAAEWDTIYVEAGAYWGEDPVTVDLSVMIDSLDGAAVDYPSFVVEGATLRLGSGTLVADTLLGITTWGVPVYAAVLVLDGGFEGHDLAFDGAYGNAIFGVDAQVRLETSAVSGAWWAPGIELYGVESGLSLDLEQVELADNTAGAVYLYDTYASNWSTFSATSCTFSGNAAPEYGGDVALGYVDDAAVFGSTFSGGWAELAAGSIFAQESDLLVQGSAFASNASAHAGAIYAGAAESTHALTIQETTFSGGMAVDAAGAGGEIAVSGVDLVLEGVRASGGSAVYGGFLYAEGGSVRVVDSAVWNASAEAGGALSFSAVPEVSVEATSLCGNVALYGPALYAYASDTSLSTTLVHLNTSSYGAAVEASGGALTMRNATFVANPAPWGSVALVDAQAALTNTIFSGSATGVSMSGSTITRAGWNLYWALDVADAGYSTEGGDVYADPRFVPAFDPTLCGSEPHLASDSPAIDAGDPALVDDDGSPSDIGAFPASGGGDTGDTGDDTGDDTGADTGDTGDPAAPDADGDGTPDDADCAPDDPARHPGAYDDPLDDVDQDCDGDAASGTARGGCDCESGGASPWLGLVALAFLRRRRA